MSFLREVEIANRKESVSERQSGGSLDLGGKETVDVTNLDVRDNIIVHVQELEATILNRGSH